MIESKISISASVCSLQCHRDGAIPIFPRHVLRGCKTLPFKHDTPYMLNSLSVWDLKGNESKCALSPGQWGCSFSSYAVILDPDTSALSLSCRRGWVRRWEWRHCHRKYLSPTPSPLHTHTHTHTHTHGSIPGLCFLGNRLETAQGNTDTDPFVFQHHVKYTHTHAHRQRHTHSKAHTHTHTQIASNIPSDATVRLKWFILCNTEINI